MSGPLPLAVALFAVLALVLLTYLLGFTQGARLAGPEHAATLAQSLRGGFAPCDIVIARDGGGALLHEREGRVAVIAAVGAHFVVRQAEPGWSVREAGAGYLAVDGGDFSAILDLGNDSRRWEAILAGQVGTRA